MSMYYVVYHVSGQVECVDTFGNLVTKDRMERLLGGEVEAMPVKIPRALALTSAYFDKHAEYVIIWNDKASHPNPKWDVPGTAVIVNKKFIEGEVHGEIDD